MWFKQLQVFDLSFETRITKEFLIENLQELAFKPCLPSMPNTMGWVSPVEEEGAELVRGVDCYHMICLQFEDKLLPASVIKDALENKVKEREAKEERKIRHKEKLAMKDEVITTLLPRAFSKFSRVYGFIDTKRNRLILGTTNPKKSSQFIGLFKKILGDTIQARKMDKISALFTDWLRNKNHPALFSIEKSCLLQDPADKKRTIRCTEQNLFAENFQALIKEGFYVKQLALTWQDRVQFVITNEGLLQGIKYEDDLKQQALDLEAETKQQVFDADFLIMSGTLSALLDDFFEAVTNVENKPALVA